MGRFMTLRHWIGLTAGLLMLSGTAAAHHSFQATYDTDDTVKIEGKLVQFHFRNPHSFVQVVAPDPESGEMVRWGVEWGGASLLSRQGIERTTFKPGDHVIITGSPGRNREDHRVRMETILRPADGFGWGQDEDEQFN